MQTGTKKRKNILRELLKAGKPTLGTHVHVSWPGMVEVIGYSGGMDYIEFSGEYAPYDLYALENFGRAIDLFPHMSSMIKIDQEPRTYLAGRAIGSGIQNLLFADIRSVEDTREAVAAARAETPRTKGYVGAAMRRDVGYLLTCGSPIYVDQLQDGVVALMIEKESAVENLESILSVPGVDMIQFGPADYSMSIGIPGQWNHPRIREAERFVIETALKMGVAPRVELGDFRDADRYLKMGVKHFCVGWDIDIIHKYCKDQGAVFAEVFGKERNEAKGRRAIKVEVGYAAARKRRKG
ncbi:MAG TPA: aldolase/citrate lyase family protein [Thermodesulfobacteriota bacterium]|nr:aldolase/citrate lyase family protein [Thermodesulfobacteriota bacterium]